MKTTIRLCCIAYMIPVMTNAQDRDQRISELERKLVEARSTVAALLSTIDSLSTEVRTLRQPDLKSPLIAGPAPVQELPAPEAAEKYREQMLRPDLGHEKDNPSCLPARSCLFNLGSRRSRSLEQISRSHHRTLS